jgi:peptide/nickel transport system permease protein
MTSHAAAIPPAGPDPAAAHRPPPRSFARRVVNSTLTSWGARIGLAWIVVLLLLSVFGPFLASSHPVLLKQDGQWSSPMLQHLSAADVTLVFSFFAAVALWPIKRLRAATKFYIWMGATAATILIAALTVSPPSVVVFEKYREAKAMGLTQAAVPAPIPYSPNDRLRDRPTIEPTAPSWAGGQGGHLLGQTTFGEDMASRMIHASRIALSIGLIATGIAGLIGVVIGGLMGYFSGAVDLIGMRLVEIFEFIPQLFLLLMFVAFFPGDNPEILPGVRVQRIYMIMVIIGLTSWPGYARFIRAEFLKLRKQDFVVAAQALGLPLRSILFKHMLPNGIAPVLVRASFGVAGAILAEAILSFIGLGLNEDPSWGKMLNEAARGDSFIWWIAIFPGLAIFLTVLAYNLIGEAMRDAIDPYVTRTRT